MTKVVRPFPSYTTHPDGPPLECFFLFFFWHTSAIKPTLGLAWAVPRWGYFLLHGDAVMVALSGRKGPFYWMFYFLFIVRLYDTHAHTYLRDWEINLWSARVSVNGTRTQLDMKVAIVVVWCAN